jgi:hypothetical protein
VRYARSWLDADTTWTDDRRELFRVAVAAEMVEDVALDEDRDATAFCHALYDYAEVAGCDTTAHEVLADLLRVWWDNDDAADRDGFGDFGPYVVVSWPAHDDPYGRWVACGESKAGWQSAQGWNNRCHTVVHIPTVTGRRAYFWSCLSGAGTVAGVVDELASNSYRTKAEALDALP